jgi:hypothetical protein
MQDGIHNYGVMLFHTSSAAFRAEKLLRKESLTAKLVPTPREYSSDCGIALRFDWGQETRVRELLESAHVEIASMHSMES